jgi:thymidylate synthase ThyX
MRIELKASTNNISTKEQVFSFARAAGRVCYSKFDFDQLIEEEDKNKLIDRLLNSGHHSPFDHVNFTFYFDGIPKFGAMILNNERPYTTSEKSARYTRMQLTDEENELFTKWMRIFENIIREKYSFLDDVKIKKLSQENARYLTSVFTPTKMLYTVSYRQLCYIIHFFKDYIAIEPDTSFSTRVKEFMKGFIAQFDDIFEKRLDPRLKDRTLSIFGAVGNQEHFGINYTTVYRISFAGLAQAHRHRTLNFCMDPLSEPTEMEFFIPPILETQEIQKEWLDDMEKIKDSFPQGTLLKVRETGTLTDFKSKMKERLCGHAQWEIMNSTKETLEKFAKIDDPYVQEQIKSTTNGPKCTFSAAKCVEPCPFGPKQGLNRKI